MGRKHRTGEAECIYCLTTKPLSDFNKEHVLPDGFGRFKGALTVLYGVCEDCNTHFGDTLDLVLGRETVEGLARYETGVKPATEVHKFKPGRVETTIDEPGPLRGAKVRPIVGLDGKSVGAGQMEQVSITDPETGETRWYTEEEVSAPGWGKRAGLRIGLDIGIYCPDDAQDRFVALLKSKGVTVSLGPVEDPDPQLLGARVPVQMAAKIDTDQLRAAGKMCLNYLASQYGNSLALESTFHDLRAFVRYDVRPPRQLVFPTFKPMLYGDKEGEMNGRKIAHLISVGWVPPGNMLVGQVSLFNLMQYRVILAEHYEGERPTIDSAHAYVVPIRQVVRMKSVGLVE